MPSQLEALLQQARAATANANSSLLDNRYPVYPGQTRPEMSAMTNRKRQIEDQYRLKRPSFTRAIQHNTHRNLGFKEGDTQSLLDRISAQQQNLGRFGTQRIKNTFGDTYSGNLEGKIGKDTLAKNAQSKVGFDNLANEARNIDTRDNNKTLQTLNALSLSKNANKEGVLGLLEQLGNQKHVYDQSKFNADRAIFNRQANYPYSRIQGIGDAISGGINVADAVRRDRLNAEQGGDFNPLAPVPSEERYAEGRLRRGMAGLNTNYPVYPGKLVADLNPDMKMSYNLAERLEPNIQDNSYEERRRLRKGLTDGDITSQRAISSLNDKASPLEQNLDKDAQKLIKQATAKINASRVMNGTFGSKSHQSELDAAIRDIVGGKYGSRANITTDTLNRSLTDLSRENNVNNERVRELDRTGSREVGDAFNQIRNINQRGATDWGNEQNRLNQAFQQFSDEADWENNNRGNLGSNPQNRGLAIAGGIDRASSQSPLVLPSALQFNNLPANIPFEESKIGAATTDPRIQRTSELFNDEAEMRRIADAARERQNREELARREAEIPRTLEGFKKLAKKRKREELLAQGATMRQVPALSKFIAGGLLSGNPDQFKGPAAYIRSANFNIPSTYHPDVINPRNSDYAKNLKYFYNPEFSFSEKARYLNPNEREKLFDLLHEPHKNKSGEEVPMNKTSHNYLTHDYTRLKPVEEGVLPNYFKTGYAHWGRGALDSNFRKPLSTQKQKLLTDDGYQRYMDSYRHWEQNYRNLLDSKQTQYNTAMAQIPIAAANRAEEQRATQEREAENQRLDRIYEERERANQQRAQQQAAAAQQQAQARAQQQTQAQNQGANIMQIYRQLIANADDTEVFPKRAINYAMTGQQNLPSGLSVMQLVDYATRLHPNHISNFNYLSQHNPSFNLAQELEYLRNLAQSRTLSAAQAQARELNRW